MPSTAGSGCSCSPFKTIALTAASSVRWVRRPLRCTVARWVAREVEAAPVDKVDVATSGGHRWSSVGHWGLILPVRDHLPRDHRRPRAGGGAELGLRAALPAV